MFGTTYFFFACDQPVWNDWRVRRGLALLVPWDQVRTKDDFSFPSELVIPSIPNYPAVKGIADQQVAEAKKLLAEAGYPDGFEVTLDCPNNRYIADEKLCVAIAGMLARIDVKVKVNAMPRAQYFPKIQNFDTSFYMLGWGVPTFDSQYAVQSLLRSYVPRTADGDYNLGRYSNPKVDAAVDKLKTEVDTARRAALAREILQIHMADVGHIPLHHQVIPWAMRSNVSVVHRADNRLTVKWVRIN
jgi:peptide/nickel transport system substrate-binding protein